MSLHLTSSNGTDLKVQLSGGHIWSGGYGENLIDDFKIEFKDGEVVVNDAKIGKEYLNEMLDMDDVK